MARRHFDDAPLLVLASFPKKLGSLVKHQLPKHRRIRRNLNSSLMLCYAHVITRIGFVRRIHPVASDGGGCAADNSCIPFECNRLPGLSEGWAQPTVRFSSVRSSKRRIHSCYQRHGWCPAPTPVSAIETELSILWGHFRGSAISSARKPGIFIRLATIVATNSTEPAGLCALRLKSRQKTPHAIPASRRSAWSARLRSPFG